MKLSDDMVAVLEEFLQADADGKLRQEIITALAALQQRLTAQTKKLQSPEDFRKIDAASRAAQNAMLVMMVVDGEPVARR